MGMKELGYRLTPPDSDKPKETRGERWARKRRQVADAKYKAEQKATRKDNKP